jgi:hypothetical protein
MAYTNKENPDCANCNKIGLAVLPVRYTVVPNHVNASLPSRLGDRITNAKLKHHKYALRTLRQGFFYLFYEKHARGSHIQWEVYSTSVRGTLWKQLSTNTIEAITEERCSRKEHSLPASVIAIESPEKCGRVWLAFSEHAWSAETFTAFEQDQALRDRRMQVFEPAAWVKTHDYQHGTKVNEASLNEIIEYKSGFPLSSLGRNNLTEISKPGGSYDPTGIRSCATRYPITVRRDDRTKLIDMMRAIGESPNGCVHEPVIIALWDNVGITHELNGYRNDAIGWVEKYGLERELEIGALAAIEGAKTALKNRNKNNVVSGMEAGVFNWNAELTRHRIENYEQAYPGNVAGRTRQEDLCRRWEQDSAARIPNSIARRRETYVRLSEPDWQAGMVEVDKAASQATTTNQVTGKSAVQIRDELIEKRANTAEKEAEDAWERYEAKLDMAALEAFKKKYAAFVSAATLLADERTEDVVTWIRSSCLQDALLEFHSSSFIDGTAFEDAVGDMILGISSSPSGLAIIKEWITEEKVSHTNLIWRSFAFNHNDGISAVNGVLAGAIAYKEVSFTESALNFARESIKYLAKIADLAKKSLSLHNTLRKADIHRVRTGGIEKILMTAGHLLFQPFFKRGADFLSEKMIMGLLLARSGVEYSKIMALLVAEAKFGRIGRNETMLMLSMGHALSSTTVSRGFKTLQDVWKDLAKNSDTPKMNANPRLAGGFNEAKELRFGMIATLVQMIYVTKLYLEVGDSPANKKLKNELLAAQLSLGAAAVDLGATAIKGLHGLKDAALGFQALKLAGGVLSAGSAWVSFQQDDAQAVKSERAGKMALARLYRLKSWVNVAAGAASVLTAFSYTRSAFDLMAAKFPTTLIGRASAMIPRIGSLVASRLLIARALTMLGGIWFSITTVVLQVVILKFSDDKLEIWCARCAFGKDSNARIKNPATQIIEFEEALVEVI